MSSTLDKISVRSKYNRDQQQVLAYLQTKLVGQKGRRLSKEEVQHAATMRYAGMLMAQEKELRDAESQESVADPSGEQAVQGDAPQQTDGNNPGSGT